ncbi:MAG: LPS assembly lipoprotein LptE [Pseudomonadota bacterium]
MWFRPFVVAALIALGALAGCTVTPLEGTGNVSAGGGSLAGIEFAGPTSRLDQKLRNELLALVGREASDEDASIRFEATVTKTLSDVAVLRGTGRSTVGKVQLTAVWAVIDIATGGIKDRGQVSATSSYDQFNQEFANQEAERDAETRAAKELALRLRPLIIRAKSKPAIVATQSTN